MVRRMTGWLGKGLIGAALLAVPTAAFAHDGDSRDRQRGDDRHEFHDRDRYESHGRPEFRFHIEVPGPEVVIPAPSCDRIWVEPVYDTVTERVWVPDVTRTEIQHVETPAQYGYRNVIFFDACGRAQIRRESVLISPARCEDVPVQVVVCPGHFEMQTHQRLVCEGHWQEAPRPQVRLEIPLPF